MTLPVQTDIILLTVLSAALASIISPFLLMGRNTAMPYTAGKAAFVGVALGIFLPFEPSLTIIIIFAFLFSFAIAFLMKTVTKNSLLKQEIYIITGGFLLSCGAILANLSDKLNTNFFIFGEISLAGLYRSRILYPDIGPGSLYALIVTIILVITILFLFYKDLKLAILDKDYAASLYIKNNYRPLLLPVLIALCTAACVQTAGVFMTCALMLLPAIIAYFYTKRLSAMIIISVLIAIASSMTGYGVSYELHASPIGSTICVMVVLFLISAFAAPETGLIYKVANKRNNENIIRENTLLLDLKNTQMRENIFDYHDKNVVIQRLNIKQEKFNKILNKLIASGLVHIENDTLNLTAEGFKKCNTNHEV